MSALKNEQSCVDLSDRLVCIPVIEKKTIYFIKIYIELIILLIEKSNGIKQNKQMNVMILDASILSSIKYKTVIIITYHK